MKKGISILVAIMLLLINFSVASGEVKNNSNEIKHYNVVFVTDSSGSMSDTDPKKIRNEAIELFMGLLTDGGNNVGSIIFSDGINSKKNILDINEKKDKASIINSVKKEQPKGWTNTGEALKTAVNMLEKNGDKSLPSIIILLTDGKTELGTGDETEDSKKKRDEAVDKAADLGYKIYTICLNDKNSPKGSVDPKELQRIAKATKGEFREVKNAEDLRDVFNLYYQLIYSTQGIPLGEDEEGTNVIPESGVLKKEFQVTDVGVQEVNVVIFGNSSNQKWKSCSLLEPSGMKYEGNKIEEMSYSSDTQTIIKIVKPQCGTWALTVKGDPGTPIKIFKIYNANLSIKTEIKEKKDNYIAGNSISFITEVYEGEKKVTDTKRYSTCKAFLEITDSSGNVLNTIDTSSSSEEGILLNFSPDKIGTYYAQVKVKSDEISAESEKFAINVGNSAPIAKKKVIEKHFNIWPFLIKTDRVIDLSGAAEDKEDSKLTYKVDSSTWLDDEYSINGNELEIKKISVSKGTFKINAYDSQGAYCTFDVKVTTTNIGIIMMILIIAGILIAIIVMSILIYIAKNKKFMGQITAENIETGQKGSPMKNRGRLQLTSFQIGNAGFDNKCYFQATNKNYVIFVSKKAVTTDSTYGKSKKVKIESSMDIRIFSDEDQTRGILVRFESLLNNDMF